MLHWIVPLWKVEGSTRASLCAPVACCFQDLVCTGGTDCADYAECHVVFDTTPLHPPTKQEVDDACHNHSQYNAVWGQPTLCEQLCQEDQVGPCCFGQRTGGASCSSALLNPTSVFCQTYASCSVVFPSAIINSPPAQPNPTLSEVCADPAQRSTCIEQCSQATCCHATTELDTCQHVHPEIDCAEFSPCNVLY